MKLGRRLASGSRCGGALIFALLTVSVVAGISYSLLRVTTFVAKRQSNATDDKRAFYLAEAGLAEAYFGLSRGYTGALGEPERPVQVTDGLLWVEAHETEPGLVSLRSTALCGGGRSTVEISVERVDVQLGIFANERIDLQVPFLLDGFDSEEASYEDQSGWDIVHVTPDGTNYYWPSTEVMWTDGTYYKYDSFLSPEVGDWVFYCYGSHVGQYSTLEYFGALAAFKGLVPPAEPTPPGGGELATGSLGPTTGAGGVLSSNGDILLSSGGAPIELYGDLRAGPDASVQLGAGVVTSGQVGQLEERVELQPVQAPQVDWLPGIQHDSVVPRVIPPGEFGYESIRVAADSELVMLGPGSAVIGDLELDPESQLSVENLDGGVELFVTGHVGFAPGSRVTVASEDPDDLTLQVVAGPDPVDLFASSEFHGGVYAPGSHVSIGRGFELFGFLASNTLEVEAGTRLHFDQGAEAVLLPRLVGWKIEEIPARVRQNRTADPYQLFYSADEQPGTIAEALRSDCWKIVVREFDVNGKELPGYAGPANGWVVDPDAFRVKMDGSLFVPPQDGSLEWYVRVHYRSKGSFYTYEGPFADFPGFQGKLKEWDLWSV